MKVINVSQSVAFYFIVQQLLWLLKDRQENVFHTLNCKFA